jgi:hypothetical protein
MLLLVPRCSCCYAGVSTPAATFAVTAG